MTRDALALVLYVRWTLASSIVNDRPAIERMWAALPDFARRPFLAMADDAIALLGRRCMACHHDATETAELRL